MISDWMGEIRPKTLLLASTNCGVGCSLGFYYGVVNAYTLTVALLIIVTGVLLQILSNFADDYGDAIKGADGPNRVGPIRAVMLGSISLTTLRKAMALVIIMATITGIMVLVMAVGDNLELLSKFAFLGVLAIMAAIFYTIGFAYGYKGFGDIAVLAFFGLASVIGSQILIQGASGVDIDWYYDTIALGLAIGLQSMMVLHVSAMRDIMEDRLSGKSTIASRLGYKKSAIYMAILCGVSALLSIGASFFNHKQWEAIVIAFACLPLAVSTFRANIHYENSQKIARERKYCLIGCTIHNLAWIIVLIIDFWIYY